LRRTGWLRLQPICLGRQMTKWFSLMKLSFFDLILSFSLTFFHLYFLNKTHFTRKTTLISWTLLTFEYDHFILTQSYEGILTVWTKSTVLIDKILKSILQISKCFLLRIYLIFSGRH
jgi:hypothetical protein